MVVAVPEADVRRQLVAYFQSVSQSAATPVAAAAPGPSAGPSAGAADWREDHPGRVHHIAAAALPAPFASESHRNPPRVVEPPPSAKLAVPPGFHVDVFARDLDGSTQNSGRRQWRCARQRDQRWSCDAAASVCGCDCGSFQERVRRRIARGRSGSRSIPMRTTRSGCMWRRRIESSAMLTPPATSSPEAVRRSLCRRYRRLAATPRVTSCSRRMARGSTFPSGLDRTLPSKCRRNPLPMPSAGMRPTVLGLPGARRPIGRTCWYFPPRNQRVLAVYAAGLRNCVGLTRRPGSPDLWCTVNERDGLGDDLVPDYSTHLEQGLFYGWPWYYLGSNEDPRLAGERPDLRGQVTVPDVLYQAHSAPLNLEFYVATQGCSAFPAEGLLRHGGGPPHLTAASRSVSQSTTGSAM
jgi:hypothetical protein